MATKKKKPLGRGLGNLLDTTANLQTGENEILQNIPVNKIKPNPFNPRKKFDKEAIDELAKTIDQFGLLQPILVQKTGDDYTVISGERRLRAVQKLKLNEIPVIIKQISERENIEISLIENIQREHLDVIEEANVYRTLMDSYQITQDELSERVGKKRSTIANRIRLLKLPEEIQLKLADGTLTEGQVRPLLALKNIRTIKDLGNQIIEKKLTARNVENLVKNITNTKPARESKKKNSETLLLQSKLEEYLNTRVKINHNEKNKKGKIIIDYFSLDEMDSILKIIGFTKK